MEPIVNPSETTSSMRPIGVEAALKAASDPDYVPRSQIFDEFKLKDRVAVVTGGNGDLGLEMALALAEAGASVHCLDLPVEPSDDFHAAAKFATRLGTSIKYHQCDVTDQKKLWSLMADIADSEGGYLDICVAAAGLLQTYNCLEYPADQWRKIIDVNTNGVFFTAQAAAQQMSRAGRGGSIVLIASMSGSVTNRGHPWTAYNTSKSAVLQMARSLACELGPQRIRVNSLSPGHIYTKMTGQLLDRQPELKTKWSDGNPLGRLGEVHELRGVVTWLGSDASTFCTGSDIIVSGGHHAW